MRIIAGLAKGRRIAGPPGLVTRPLPDRVREALFSSLGDVSGVRVLDLYAGSGSIGLEALSRGAASVVFVEKSRSVTKTLHKNVDVVGLGGDVVVADVAGFLTRDSGTYDLVFVDPPYSTELPSVEAELASLVRLLEPGATVVVHRRYGGAEPDAGGLKLTDRRRYGDTELFRFEAGSKEEDTR
ncbi:MAG: 16S rRNA (guanine(966)-N(2))-methyltransferase RsmD [Acidimicrobiia bacterium]|nr:16S rRNA (guanine(966)-N(2))-methyltransferase RsmD [Acidimicrobiia bacterium]